LIDPTILLFSIATLELCLRDSSIVLNNYMENNQSSGKIPWDDLKYIFGEIMYGGHITDGWDRRTNNTYLKVLIRPEILNGMQLTCAPGFKSPDPMKFDREAYRKYIEEKLP
jgi:dynein heavy chain